MRTMKRFRTYATWGLAVAAILLSPIFLIFAIVAAIGIGLDIFDICGEGPVALALSIPVAFLLLRRMPSRRSIATFLRSRLHLGHATPIGYTPKSIS
jgi:cell shape-determining protein MreD